MINVCLLNPFTWPFRGGIETQLYQMCELLKDKINFTFISPVPDCEMEQAKNYDYAEIIPIKCKRVSYPYLQPAAPVYNILEMRKKFNKNSKNFDVIHSFFTIYTTPIIDKINKPHLFSEMNVPMYGSDVKQPYRSIMAVLHKTLLNKVYSKSDRIISISDYIKKKLEENEELSNIETIYAYIDTRKFKPKKVGKGEKFRIFLAGRIVKEKGFQNVIRAVAKSEHKKDIEVVLAGKGSYLTYLKRISNKQEVDFKAVGFAGQSELINMYNSADIFVTPSLWEEPFGIVNIEAMSCGKPVIGTISGGIPEIIEDGKTGILYKKNDVSKLKDSIDLLYEDEQLRRKMGKNGRKRAVKMFDAKKNTIKYYKTYKKMLE